MKKIILLLALFFALPFYSQNLCDPSIHLAYAFDESSCPSGQSLRITSSPGLSSEAGVFFVITVVGESFENAFPPDFFDPNLGIYEGTYGPYAEGVKLEIYMEYALEESFCVSFSYITDGTPGCNTGCQDSDGDNVCDEDDNCPLLANPLQEPDVDCDGVLTELDCDDNDINNTSTNVNDADCDGVPTADDCNDNDNSITTTNANDADCDGVPTVLDCNDTDPNITDRLDADEDGDGVADCNDQQLSSPCPDNVDQFGVSIDSDNDGTADCLDDCPIDPNKILEGICGCGSRETDRDGDGDGVADCIDQELRSPCPNVDEFGVSIDEDNDTVPDCLDKCPPSEGKAGDDRIDTDGDKIPDDCDDSPLCRGNKIAICHNRNGVFTTLCISPGQLQRHLDHGDIVGPCEGATSSSVIYETEEMIAEENSINEAQLSVYPNPARSDLNVRLNSLAGNEAKYSIYNFNGVKVKEGSIKSLDTKIDLDGSFSSGLYFIIVESGTTRMTKQFVVEK